MTKLFNYDPYNDDFDEDKNFMRVLFRPGYSLQARELTQLQTILSNQIEKFGNHIFKNGSPITGGKISLDDRAYYLSLKTQYSGQDIVLENFLDKTIVSYNSNKIVRAKVIAIDNTTSFPTLVVKYLSGDFFGEGDELKVYGQNIFAELQDSNATGRSYVSSIQEGVYYFKGQFVKVNPQFLVLELYYKLGLNSEKINKQPSYRIGIEFDELVIDEIDDVTLLDPAQGSFNYQAPGATRFKINTTLSKRSLDSVDESSFFEVIRIVNGVKTKEIDYPIYSEIEKTLARRTFEESGNYTVDPFVISIDEEYVDTANNNYVDPNYFEATLDPGKAYVGGYEVQTIAPTNLKIARGRTTASINDYDLPTNYSSYVYVANVYGTLVISDFELLDIHCAKHDDVSFASTTEYKSSKIGTVRANMMKYFSAGDPEIGTTHEFTINVFDVNTSSITGSVASSGSTNSVVALPSSFAQLPANTYQGMFFSIKDGAGKSLAPIRISQSSGSSKTITLSSSLPFIPSSNSFSIDSDFKFAESLIKSNGSKLFAADLTVDSKTKDSDEYAFIKEPTRQGLIFNVPFDAIKENTITNFDFYARKVYLNKLTNNSGIISINLAGTSDTFAFAGTPGVLSDNTILENIICFIRSDGNTPSGINGNTVLSLANTNFVVSAVSSSEITINFDPSNTGNFGGIRADFIITTKVNNAENGSTGAVRSKVLYPLLDNRHEKVAYMVDPTTGLSSANTGTVVSFSGGYVFPDIGVTFFDNETGSGDAGTVKKLKTPGQSVSLQVPDVLEIVKIIDSRTSTGNITTSMLTDPLYDVTNRYEFNNGQKTTHYDHATIKLKRGFSSPIGSSIYVMYKYLSHGSAPSPQNIGLFTVDSYLNETSSITYDTISKFIDRSTGKILSGRSTFDFRPTRQIASNTLSGAVCPDPDEIAEVSFENYLSRIDKIVVKPSREIVVIEGQSAVKSVPPPHDITDMLLYTLYIPPYTEVAKDVRVEFHNNRRFTMRDIGAFENRIRGLEYYISLNSLEKNANDSKILDANGLERSKYGILVDNFTSTTVQATYGDVGFDNRNKVENGELKPASLMSTIKLLWSESNSTGSYKVVGTSTQKSLIMNYTSKKFADQPYATKTIPIASALYGNFNGTLKLFPEFTSEHDTSVTAKVTLNSVTGLKEAFDFVDERLNYVADQNPSWLSKKDSPFAKVSDDSWYETKTTVDKTVDLGNNTRGNLQTTTDHLYIKAGSTKTADQITVKDPTLQDLGSYVTNTSLNPYLKPRGIVFVGSSLRPLTRFYSYFDNQLVEKYTIVPTKVKLTENSPFKSGEMVLIASTNAELNQHIDNFALDNGTYNLGVCAVSEVGTSDISLVNESSLSLAGKYVYGLDSKITKVISSVLDHRCGNTRSVTSSTITLAEDAPSTSIVGSTISLVRRQYGNDIDVIPVDVNPATGIGSVYTITAYNTTSKVATISGTVNAAEVGKTFSYSIGTNVSNKSGQIGGIFYPPQATFLSGERTYRLTESFNNSYDKDAISFADKNFASSGITTTKTSLVDTVYNIGITSEVVGTIDKNTPLLVSSTVNPSKITSTWRVDPLAQTFYVDEQTYPNGLYLESVNLFFSAKDSENVPVRVQVRPTENGIPSFNYWYPESVVEKYPSQIIVSSTPNINDDNTKNTFTFDSPIFLKPGLYALVILTDSPDYVVWTAEKGQTTLSNQTVSVNPYVGTLYKSQNAMEYVPYLNEDLMFELNRCVFNTNSATFLLQSEKQKEKLYIDRFRLLEKSITSQSSTPISINYSFISKPVNSSKETIYRNISPSTIYNMGDDTFYSIGNRRKEIKNKNDFTVRLEISTTDDTVTPLVSLESLYLNTWENFIDDGEINPEDFNIIAPGAKYTNANVINVISSTGQGANLEIVVNSSAAGNVVRINVASSGIGYVDDFYISYPHTSNSSTVIANASIVLNSEFDNSGGPCLARYITKPIVLTDGFDAGDLRVFLAANKPVGTELHVFYKILSGSDITNFSDRPYGKFQCLNPSVGGSTDETEFIEYEYRPSLTSDELTYTSADGVIYDTFKTFAIKIVMTSQDPSVIPRVKDLRIIALPAG